MSFAYFKNRAHALLVVVSLIGLGATNGWLAVSAQTAAPTMASTAAATMASTAAAPGAATTAATAPATMAASAVPKPVISAQLNGAALGGTPGSYCWPQPGQAVCANIDPAPASFAPVKPGDTLVFSVDPAAGAPVALIASFSDDIQADGSPLQVDLLNAKNSYTVAPTLTDGKHRIEVEAAYTPAADGSQNYVDYIFGVQVNNPSNPVVQATTAATATAAVVAPSDTPAANATQSAATAAPDAATGQATLPPTATKIPTVAPTAVPPTVAPTATLIPSATPSPVPTIIPATPTATGLPGLSLGSGLSVPSLLLTVGGKSYSPVAVTAVIQDPSGTVISITRPVSANAPYVRAIVNSDAQLQFNGPTPVSELVTLLNADATVTLKQQSIPPDGLTLYGLPAKAGIYALYVAIQWPQGQATYIFRLQITS